MVFPRCLIRWSVVKSAISPHELLSREGHTGRRDLGGSWRGPASLGRPGREGEPRFKDRRGRCIGRAELSFPALLRSPGVGRALFRQGADGGRGGGSTRPLRPGTGSRERCPGQAGSAPSSKPPARVRPPRRRRAPRLQRGLRPPRPENPGTAALAPCCPLSARTAPAPEGRTSPPRAGSFRGEAKPPDVGVGTCPGALCCGDGGRAGTPTRPRGQGSHARSQRSSSSPAAHRPSRVCTQARRQQDP